MKIYHLFISHSWKYGDAYERLVILLRKKSSFHFRDYSIPRSNPILDITTNSDLYGAIHDKMSRSSVVVVPAGVYATHSEWINKELYIAKHAFTHPKPILAILPWGSQRTSTRVKRVADRVVKWNTNSIVRAVRELAR